MTAVNAEASFALPAVLDLTAALPLRDALLARLRDGDLAVQAEAVERVSTPCLQVLAAAAAMARQRGSEFKLDHPSTVLVEAIEDLGLQATIRGERQNG